jgi:hypothetical protein
MIVGLDGEVMDYGLNSRFVTLRWVLQALPTPRNEEGGSEHRFLKQI